LCFQIIEAVSVNFAIILQARNCNTKEVVAVKKMSYQGRQSSDVSIVFIDYKCNKS